MFTLYAQGCLHSTHANVKTYTKSSDGMAEQKRKVDSGRNVPDDETLGAMLRDAVRMQRVSEQDAELQQSTQSTPCDRTPIPLDVDKLSQSRRTPPGGWRTRALMMPELPTTKMMSSRTRPPVLKMTSSRTRRSATRMMSSRTRPPGVSSSGAACDNERETLRGYFEYTGDAFEDAAVGMASSRFGSDSDGY